MNIENECKQGTFAESGHILYLANQNLTGARIFSFHWQVESLQGAHIMLILLAGLVTYIKST